MLRVHLSNKDSNFKKVKQLVLGNNFNYVTCVTEIFDVCLNMHVIQLKFCYVLISPKANV